MNRIQKLPLHEAQKIAAGEVVERPANVVKELLENALDAGATEITLHLENAGKDCIRIVDNGCGMSPDDARLCIEQYATSKIRAVDELPTITTFGFRGEALASIVAVSHCTIVTKQEHAAHGIQLTVVDGIIQSHTPVGCNTGTDITIRNLLHNVPARRKFLRTRQTEWHQIYTLLQATCMRFQSVHISVWHDGVQVFNCPPTADVQTRLAQLWDHTFAQQMITLDLTQTAHAIRVTGVTSIPTYGRYDRSQIIFFVNGRWIKNHQLAQALIKGYANVLAPGRYPAACVFLEVNPHDVDINIHPRKEEVLFLHPRHVEQALQQAVTAALEKHTATIVSTQRVHTVPQWSTPVPYMTAAPAYTPTFTRAATPAAVKYVDTVLPEKPVIQQTVITSTHHTVIPHGVIIGQYQRCYILVEHEQALCLVDQHAAHERILYEQFSTRFEPIASIPLLFAHTIAISNADAAIIEPYLSVYQEYGIDISVFDDTHLIVRATPVHAKDIAIHDLVHHTIADLKEDVVRNAQEIKKSVDEKLRAQMACKAAIKAGDVLDQAQMEQLLTRLRTTNNCFSCPHGRPTQWLLPHYEIEKKFKRKL